MLDYPDYEGVEFDYQVAITPYYYGEEILK